MKALLNKFLFVCKARKLHIIVSLSQQSNLNDKSQKQKRFERMTNQGRGARVLTIRLLCKQYESNRSS